MRIAILGKGQVGQAIATALRRSGCTVIFGARVPDGAQTDETTVTRAVEQSDATILATPFNAAADVIAAAGGFVGRILIDATNPLGRREHGLGLTCGFETSGAEMIAAMAPQAHVFKAFNQTGFENMTEPGAYAARPVMFVGGDSDVAKPVVLGLVTAAGFEAIDAGALHAARLLEPLAMLWIELARKRGLGPDFAFTLQRKA
jgi:predicted dinucleotide-binding enzyme